jgi:hypothetical protein
MIANDDPCEPIHQLIESVQSHQTHQHRLTADAEVIIETCNATDAGRILLGFENGRRSLEEVELIRYIDKGWVIKE